MSNKEILILLNKLESMIELHSYFSLDDNIGKCIKTLKNGVTDNYLRDVNTCKVSQLNACKRLLGFKKPSSYIRYQFQEDGATYITHRCLVVKINSLITLPEVTGISPSVSLEKVKEISLEYLNSCLSGELINIDIPSFKDFKFNITSIKTGSKDNVIFHPIGYNNIFNAESVLNIMESLGGDCQGFLVDSQKESKRSIVLQSEQGVGCLLPMCSGTLFEGSKYDGVSFFVDKGVRYE